jgi:hypothetical protein
MLAKLRSALHLFGAVLLCVHAGVTLAVTTVTSVSSNLDPSLTSETTVITADVIGQAPSGTVAFSELATLVPGCESVPLAVYGSGARALCNKGGFTAGSHTITAAYSGDANNDPSSGSLTIEAVEGVPGIATIVSNPYGSLAVQGAQLAGNTIFNFTGNTVIQLGPSTGPGEFQLDFDAFNLASGNSFKIRSGAAGQVVALLHADAKPSIVAGSLVAEDGGLGAPNMSYDTPGGLNVRVTGSIVSPGGLNLDLLAGSWYSGKPLYNDGLLDGGVKLDMYASDIHGGGQFAADDTKLHVFGSANNPVHGAHFLQNGLDLRPGPGALPYRVLVNAYGTSPQFINLHMGGDVTVWMPSQWPYGFAWPANQFVIPPGSSRPAGAPEPSYGGSSIILQSTGTLSLFDGGSQGTGDLAFAGGIVLKSPYAIDLKGVTINQGWTTAGRAFQGFYAESPYITNSKSSIDIYSNDLNWTNFSTKPDKPVHVWRLTGNANGGASYAPADLLAPHLNTYSQLIEAAANGQDWTSLVNTQAYDMTQP